MIPDDLLPQKSEDGRGIHPERFCFELLKMESGFGKDTRFPHEKDLQNFPLPSSQ